MKLIVGLGNIGKEYQNTRHNVGFLTIDNISIETNINFSHNKFDGLYGIGYYNNHKIILLKPQSYMNNSGIVIKNIINYYKIDIKDILVIYDEVDLPIGKIRIKPYGSSNGQKGMQNIIDNLNDTNINRLRIGIGNNPQYDIKDYVLSKFDKEEKLLLDTSISKATKASLFFIDNDIVKTMNNYNS